MAQSGVMKYLPENRVARLLIVNGAFLALYAVALFVVAPGLRGPARGTPMSTVFQGAVFGLVISLFAVGLILVYRTMRFINFAQGLIGSVGSTLLLHVTVFTPLPFLVGYGLGMAFSVAVGAVVGVFLLRFFNSSRLFITVVTIAGALVIQGISGLIDDMPFWPEGNQQTTAEAQDLQNLSDDLPFQGFEFEVGDSGFVFGFEQIFAIEIALLALLAVGAFLRFTRAGTAVRAMAENSERATLLGISVGTLSVIVWMIAAALDFVAVTAAQAAAPDIGTGFRALVLPFAVCIIARFRSIPMAVYAGVILGVAQFAWDYSFRGATARFEIFLFFIIGVGLLLQRKELSRSEKGGGVAWQAVEEPRPIPREMRKMSQVRLMRAIVWTLGVGFLLIFPWTVTTLRQVEAAQTIIFAIVALSLVVLTGWAGQVSLGQWGMLAVGAVFGGWLIQGIGFWLAIPLAVVMTGAMAILVGLPALRIKGLFLLVSTFAFAAGIGAVIFDEAFPFRPSDEAIDRPTLLFLDFDDERMMYYLSAAFLITTIVVLNNLRRSRFGRMLIAMRENEANVQSFGISPVRAKLTAFAVSGGICGFAGVLMAAQARGVGSESFALDLNVFVFVSAVIGGVASPAGAILGALYFRVVQTLAASNEIASFLFARGGPLIILFIAPGGLISLVNGGRDSILRIIAQRQRMVIPSLFADYDPDVLERQLIPLGEADLTSGLAAVPPDERFVLQSELYRGKGERVIDKLGPKRVNRETAALSAAAGAALEAEREVELADIGSIAEADSVDLGTEAENEAVPS